MQDSVEFFSQIQVYKKNIFLHPLFMKSNLSAKIQRHISQDPQCAMWICAPNFFACSLSGAKIFCTFKIQSEISFLCSVTPIQ